MAKFGSWIDGYLQINAVDLSDHVRDMSLDTSVVELPDNCHGDNVAKVCAGLEQWQIAVTFLQDFGLHEVDAVLAPLRRAGADPFYIVIGGSTDNPTVIAPWYKASGIITSYKPIGGTHGSNMEALAVFQVVSGISRITNILQDRRLRPLDHSGRQRPLRHTALQLPQPYAGWAD